MKHDNPLYWRSLDELASTDEFRAFVEDEFPNRTPDWNDPASRRRFLRLMGASIALAGASACTKQPKEMIVPYVRQPEEMIPGKPLFYATAMSVGGHCDRCAGREPSGAAHKNRRQPGTSWQSWRNRRGDAGERSDACTIPIGRRP